MIKRLTAAIGVALLLAPALVLAETEFSLEQPHAIPLEHAVPAAMHSGPGYTLGESVFVDGFSQSYVITTEEFGEFQPSSNYMLDVRISEVFALRKAAKIRKSKAYLKAVAKAGAAPLYLAKDLITRPVTTLVGVPKGLWRMGTKAVKWIGGDRRQRADTENSATREAIGVSGRKRAIAQQLGVDPYTSNLKLQDELDGLAWASFAGGLTVTLAMAAVAIPPAATLTYRVTNLTKKTNEMVTSVSGGDLYRMNRATLHSMGFSEEETVAFLGNPHLSPSRKAAITVAIESLGGTSGLKHIVALGSMIETESGAVRLQRTTELISAYHRGIARVATVVRWENELFVKDRDGNSIAVLPADRLLWTEQTRNFADGMRAATHPDSGLAIWTTGVFSDTTRTAMTDRGILFRDKIEHK